MVRTDRVDKRITYLHEDGSQPPLAWAKPEAAKIILATRTGELVLFPHHDEARTHTYTLLGKKFVDAVPEKRWEQTRFLLKNIDGSQCQLFAHEEELAAFDPTYIKLCDGPGEWRAEGPLKPLYRVDGTEVVALVMGMRTDLAFRLPVAA